MSDNMRFYNAFRKVPEEAKKPIMAGRLKGMTDINPVYRFKVLTEMFGPCGIGWWYEITKKELINDELTKQVAAFVDILLFYKDPETGDVSRGIPGTGGASFIAQERSGPYLSDECFKMALTDAISVSCKALGIAADVYYAKDRTKYSLGENANTAPDGQKGPSKPPQTQPKERVTEQPKAAENAQGGPVPITSRQMATEDRKKMIISTATDDEYMEIMQRYGANLENLTANQASAEIRKLGAKIDKPEQTDGVVLCERCGKPVTGHVLPDGTLMSAAEIIGKSKVKYNGVYCFGCASELNKASKSRKAG